MVHGGGKADNYGGEVMIVDGDCNGRYCGEEASAQKMMSITSENQQLAW
jgi:hypothetical protein